MWTNRPVMVKFASLQTPSKAAVYWRKRRTSSRLAFSPDSWIPWILAMAIALTSQWNSQTYPINFTRPAMVRPSSASFVDRAVVSQPK